MINTPPLLAGATYVALLFAIFGLWFGRKVWIIALALAVILGYAAHVLVGVAGVWILAFAGLCAGYDCATTGATTGASGTRRRLYRALSALGILVFGVLLAAHALPGFRNFLILDRVVLSDGAAPFTLYLNFDKTLVGLCILGFCHRALLVRASEWPSALRHAVPIMVINVVVVAVGACTLGYLTWQPKWTPIFWIWAPVNLFFVCVSEEAFFRGFIQRELTSSLQRMRYGSGVAIAVSGVLFGAAHFAGGTSYIALATVAGLGYGIVYHRTQSIEMSMLAHFTLNATHFLLFTYPQALGH
jgi:membrane protease YdiL (CAAX protease family)